MHCVGGTIHFLGMVNIMMSLLNEIQVFNAQHEEKPLNAWKTCSFGIGRGQKLGHRSESKMSSVLD